MPVRKIPKSYRNLTGTMKSQINEKMIQFESSLERDFLILCEFELNVVKYEEQPLKIFGSKHNGVEFSYTPDVLVSFSDGMNVLYEVKYRRDIEANWKKLKPKFRSAIRHCKKAGWQFKLVTEKEIRGPYLDNARFLLNFRNREFCPEWLSRVGNQIGKQLALTGSASVYELLERTCSHEEQKAEFIPAIWHLVSNQKLTVDLDIPLTMSSVIEKTPIQDLTLLCEI